MNTQANYHMISGKDQLNIINEISILRQNVWLDFIRLPEDIIFNLYKLYPDFQFSLLDSDTNKLIGIANTVPLTWNEPLSKLSDEGLNWVLNTGINVQTDTGLENILCAISITVSKNYRNKGISKVLLQHLKKISSNKKLTHLIVPVRPSFKSLYPLIPIDKYLEWKNQDGLVFDPWLRIHVTLGAKILKICHHSACVKASIEQWEKWTEGNFPGDGAYVIKDALAPIIIDSANNLGTYTEPNVWVYYSIE